MHAIPILFMIVSVQLNNNNTLKFSSDNFLLTLRYIVIMENCGKYITMYHCPSIAGKRSSIVLKCHEHRLSECDISIFVFLSSTLVKLKHSFCPTQQNCVTISYQEVHYPANLNKDVTLSHSCLKLHGGFPIVLGVSLDPLVLRIDCLVI